MDNGCPVNLNQVAQEFLADIESIKLINDSFLSSVAIINGRFILRGRNAIGANPFSLGLVNRFLVPINKELRIEIPVYLTSRKQETDVLAHGKIWNFYEMVGGKSICNWWEMYSLPLQRKLMLFETLKKIRSMTMLSESDSLIKSNYCFIRDLKYRLNSNSNLLNEDFRIQIDKILNNVELERISAKPHELCFVHGDFHSGNVLYLGGRVSGLIDLDWMRVGFPEEDLGYLIMMICRNLDGSLTFNPRGMSEIINIINASGINCFRLNKYIVLFAVFDLMLFSSFVNTEPGKYWFEYQKFYLGCLLEMFDK